MQEEDRSSGTGGGGVGSGPTVGGEGPPDPGGERAAGEAPPGAAGEGGAQHADDLPAPAADDPEAAGRPDDLPALLSALGRLLEEHAPGDVAVLLRAEIERREIRAYALGWREAAAEYESALEEVRRARARPLRVVDRTPGQAAVIPFPRDRVEAAGVPGAGMTSDAGRAPAAGRGTADDASGGAGEPVPLGGHRGGRAGWTGPHDGPGPGEGRAPAPGAVPAPPAAAPGNRPGLVPKRRTSKVPTIPRIPSPRARRPAPGREPP
ncbi:hypothetical protein OG393_12315 [Streptomyces sp. NBC_01216]|uniref:hypothetical protein n=1 Tax=Streptomyces sp. NBC_01216 TaxID=2903778 RepID=UPI002E0D2434|nr:hypothetical protein OG393_12315 [Streptomyces sp. NBC_01216]